MGGGQGGGRKDIHESFVQLILTIGRARTFDTECPPLFLGAFDAEKIAFLPYNAVQDVFAQNDFLAGKGGGFVETDGVVASRFCAKNLIDGGDVT